VTITMSPRDRDHLAETGQAALAISVPVATADLTDLAQPAEALAERYAEQAADLARAAIRWCPDLAPGEVLPVGDEPNAGEQALAVVVPVAVDAPDADQAADVAGREARRAVLARVPAVRATAAAAARRAAR